MAVCAGNLPRGGLGSAGDAEDTARGQNPMTEPAKLLLLASLLANDRIITNNGKAFLKELILSRNATLLELLRRFEDSSEAEDRGFLKALARLIEERQEAAFNHLFSECSLEDGKVLSKSEREEYSLQEDKSLIYGEVEFRSFSRVLRKINPLPGGIFYDLGSGTSRALFVARLTQDFRRCVGVEVLTSLHEAALTVIAKFNRFLRGYLNTTQPQEVEAVNGSFLDLEACDWSDGDLVFANSTCFDDSLIAGIAERAERLKPGAYVVTFTKGLESRAFEVLDKRRYKMSWGPATVFIHRRLNHDGTPYRDEQEEGARGAVNGLSAYLDDDEEYEEDDDDEDLQRADDLDLYGDEEDEEEDGGAGDREGRFEGEQETEAGEPSTVE